jgi:hypothetical protein
MISTFFHDGVGGKMKGVQGIRGAGGCFCGNGGSSDKGFLSFLFVREKGELKPRTLCGTDHITTKKQQEDGGAHSANEE